MLFANHDFPLCSIYHHHRMIYRVLSESCVYFSCYYGDVRAPHCAGDIGTGVPESRSSLSNHSFSTAHIVIHYRYGGQMERGQRQVIFS